MTSFLESAASEGAAPQTSKPPHANDRRYRGVPSAFAVMAVLEAVVLWWASDGVYNATVVVSAAGFGLLAIGFNIIAGLGGRLAFGNTIFFGIGAFAVAGGIVNHWYPGIVGPFVAMAVAGISAFVLSRALWKLSGLVFALVTFAISIMLEELVTLGSTFGGPSGLQEPFTSTDSLSKLALISSFQYAVVGAVLVLAATLVLWWTKRSGFGSKLMATRDDLVAAESVGIDTKNIAAYAWALSAVVTAIGGVFVVQSNSVIDGSTGFGLNTGIDMIAAAIIGGLGSVFGPAIGAALVGAGLLLNKLSSGTSLPGINQLVYGAALIITVRIAPGGIVGSFQALRRRRTSRNERPVGPDVVHNNRNVADLAGILGDRGAAKAGNWTGEYLLETVGLEKRFGGVTAVSNVSMGIRPAEVVGLVGPNGAGKSTLFNCIEGIERLSAGQVKYQGRRIDGLGTHERAQLGIGRTFQSVRLFKAMSVAANIAMPAIAAGEPRVKAERLARELADFMRVGDVLDQTASELSLVHQRRVELARAVCSGYSLVLLDEVMTGLADEEAGKIGTLVQSLSREMGVAFLVVEHVMGRLIPIVDRLVVMDFGAVIADGRPEDVLEDERVKTAYLGRAAGIPDGRGGE